MHGGVIALLCDELLGYTGVANDAGAFTGTLEIRYIALTPIGREITMRARVAGTEGRKVFIEGELFAGEQQTVATKGIFVRPRDDTLGEQARMA